LNISPAAATVCPFLLFVFLYARLDPFFVIKKATRKRTAGEKRALPAGVGARVVVVLLDAREARLCAASASFCCRARVEVASAVYILERHRLERKKPLNLIIKK
jgi:hypothetical protein